MKFLLLSSLLLTVSNPALAEPLCSPLNYCQVKKITWEKNRWKTLLEKEIKLEKFCDHDRPQLDLEKNLGLELWLFPGDKEKSGTFRAQPYITVNLYTHKLTHVVASASVPLSASSLAFSHRLKPSGKEVVEITCENR